MHILRFTLILTTALPLISAAHADGPPIPPPPPLPAAPMDDNANTQGDAGGEVVLTKNDDTVSGDAPLEAKEEMSPAEKAAATAEGDSDSDSGGKNALDDETGYVGGDGKNGLPVDGRIKLLKYDANDIYTVTTRVGYQTNIEFSTQEEIQTISVGDRSFWQIIPNGNRLFIRPMSEDVSTNMTVITSKRSYQFDLKSVDSKTRRIIYVARFIYPEDRPKQPAAAAVDPFLMQPVQAAPVTPVSRGNYRNDYVAPEPMIQPPTPAAEYRPLQTVAEGRRNYLYTFAGPEKAAPYEVFDDGTFTYIRYNNMTRPLPRVSIVENGQETPIAVTRRDTYFVVDRVAGEMIVRDETGTAVFVYNEMLTPQT